MDLLGHQYNLEGTGGRARRRAEWQAVERRKRQGRIDRRLQEARLRGEVARLRAENRLLREQLECSRGVTTLGPATIGRGTQTTGRSGQPIRWGLLAAGIALGLAAAGGGAPISAVCLAFLTPTVERALA